MGQALGGFNGGRCFCLCVQGFDRRHALGLAAFGPTRFLGFWGYIRFFGCGGWRFRPYGESPFPDAEKVTEKACSCVRPARWGSGFLRSGTDPWGSASGLLRCTSSRCVWLRQTVAALPPPDQSLHSAFRRRPWIKIKSGTRACAHCFEWGGCAAWGIHKSKLWELACRRWRPDSRPISN